MSKSSKFGQFLKSIKSKFSRKSSDEEYEDGYVGDYEDELEEYEDGEYEEEYEEEYEDDYDETDPSFQTLTVTDVKKNLNDDAALMSLDDDDEDDFNLDDDGDDFVENTNPSFQEFDPEVPASKIKAKFPKVGTALSNFSSRIGGFGGISSGIGSKINFDGIFDGLFSPQNRPKIHRTFIIGLFAGSSYLGGKVITNILTPAPTAKKVSKANPSFGSSPERQSLARMKNNDLFKAPEKSKEPIKVAGPTKDNTPKNEPRVCRKASKKTSLSVKLLNTVVLQDEVKSLASVQMRGKPKYLRVGDSIPNTLEVGSIENSRLIFKNLRSRQCEYAENTKKPKRSKAKPIRVVKDKKKARKIMEDSRFKGIKNEGNTFNIPKKTRAEILENISEVLTQAKAVQIKNPDGTLAFRMTEVVPGSIYSTLNIQNNDIITGIDGKSITSMNELMNLFGQIDQRDRFEIKVKRDGVEQNLEYNFQ